jgi:hypothetical protein
MRWEDERWVKLYTRDTGDWLLLSFEAQGLFRLLLTKVDGAGIIHLGRAGKRAVAGIVGHPTRWATIEPALDELLADSCVVLEGDQLIMPNFIEAQEAKTSDKEKKRRQREADRSKALSVLPKPPETLAVTERHHMGTSGDASGGAGDKTSPDVTDSHRASPDVPNQKRPDQTRGDETRVEVVPPPTMPPPQDIGKGVVITITPPTTPPEAWSAQDFWAWAQGRRVAGGLLPEKPPNPRGLGGWYSTALSTPGVTAEALKRGFYAFGVDPWWEDKGFPFNGFMSQWSKYTRPEVRDGAAA